MTLTALLLNNLAVIGGVMIVLWAISLVRRDASIVDIFWGTGFVVLAWVSLSATESWSWKTCLLATAVTIWGLRLSLYLGWRNGGKPEDYRYQAMRERHGDRFPLVSLFTVFGLQGALMWIIGLPVQVGMMHAEWLPLTGVAGITLWLAGLFFESVGDFQLARFKADEINRGRVMNRGLWRYTRHPNYFGDFLVWWGFYLMAFDAGSWWTIAGPLLMSFLLIRVSGVRLLENSLRSRVAGYEEYLRTTSSFFPWPPRRGAPSR